MYLNGWKTDSIIHICHIELTDRPILTLRNGIGAKVQPCCMICHLTKLLLGLDSNAG